MKEKYDVAVYGLWYGNNYGSIITYYALTRVLEDMHLSYAMIRNPLGREIDIDSLERSHPLRFARDHYKITPLLPLSRLSELNENFSAFLLGSDQMWNYHLSRPYGQSYFFDFVSDNKRKIAYATSFGRNKYIGPDDEKEKIFRNLRRFNAISVRDDFSERICRDDFSITVEKMIDPVFLCAVEKYDELINGVSDFKIEEEYIFAYILDPDAKLGTSIQGIAEQTQKRVIVVFNQSGDKENFKERLHISSDLVSYEQNPTVNEWLYLFKHSKYVITDSFHGTCFSIIFHKPFIVLKNLKRGGERFPNLLGEFNLIDRMIEQPEDFPKKFFENGFELIVDYKQVDKVINEKKKEAVMWLETNLKGDRGVSVKEEVINSPLQVDKKVEKLYQSPEFVKVRILVTLLRDYGIRHIVLSPGGRDVPIVRMFEYNEKYFKLYFVTDERSAAYFGLGLATQLRKPVACVCTSGTAASNYLPAVTEAYFTKIPLIVITADRLDVYHNQGEDQTIPQKNIYAGVIKKEITIPEGLNGIVEYQTRRDVSECILEATHNECGPVHINIAIENITVGKDVPHNYWELLPKIQPHILRVGLNDKKSQLMKWCKSLKVAKRILVVYGQNAPQTVEQLENINSFVSKYNCVIVTDPISNLHCDYSIMPHNMLLSISNERFNKELSPEIIITVGGKRLMNDPLTFKVRNGAKSIRHWSVTPDGTVKDFYFRLTSVLEMSQDTFFKLFSEMAGDSQNNGNYYRKWTEVNEEFTSPVIEKFNSHYIQSMFLPAIPHNSMLHLGVGLSFYDCRKFNIDKSIEVYCNMGTNGIDGCTSTFMGQCAVLEEKLCFLLVGDLSFFYDMNSIWNKKLNGRMRILMVNNNGTGLLRNHKLKGISSVHNTVAKGWVESTGFEYIDAKSKEDFDSKLRYFVDSTIDKPLFFEVFCE